ncbi:MAG: hypothetical protein ABH828_01730 [archaeon]
MKTKIGKKDLENPQRFVGEGLGAPEVKIIGASKQILEAEVQRSADSIHC